MHGHPIRSGTRISVFIFLLSFAVGFVCTPATQAQEPEIEGLLKPVLQTNPSDQELVEGAMKLLKARADGKISMSTYADGVRCFKTHHPGFYGAFFGDPFYATYDARYFYLTRKRIVVNLDVNPQTSAWDYSWLFCHPYGYDPAFNGICRGFSFPRSDFWILPLFARPPVYGPPVRLVDSKRPVILESHIYESGEGDAFGDPRPPDTTSQTSSGGDSEPLYPPQTIDAIDSGDIPDVSSSRPIEITDLEVSGTVARREGQTLRRNEHERILRHVRRRLGSRWTRRGRWSDMDEDWRDDRELDRSNWMNDRERRNERRRVRSPRETSDRTGPSSGEIERRGSSRGSSSGDTSGRRGRRNGGEREHEREKE